MYKQRLFHHTIRVKQTNHHPRVYTVVAAIAVAFCIIALRLVTVSVLESQDEKVAYSRGSHLTKRAEIVDRNGELLAINLKTQSLYANPSHIIDMKEAVTALTDVFPEMGAKDLYEKLTSDKQFVWLKRHLTPEQQLHINNKGIPGLYFETEERRIYPKNDLMAHVLGYINVDGMGLAGVERHLNERIIEDNVPLKLSLDTRIQSIAYQALKSHKEKFSAKAGVALVTDIHTGEVLAMVSLPSFDPHHPEDASKNAIFNRASLGAYEMGSTFKSFTMAMALDKNPKVINSYYDVHQPIHVGRFKINDFHQKKTTLSFSEVFLYSSNIGTAHVAEPFSVAQQKTFLESLGLLSKVPIELSETTQPLYPRDWSEVSKLTISYGHGIAVTPLHLAQATAAIINGGILHPLTLLKQGEGDQVDIPGKRVISAKTSDIMRQLLYLVVSKGTGSKSFIPGYFVGGKTGTAEKPGRGGYNKNAMISSFVGVFPMYDPQYVVFAMLDEPNGIKETGGYATGGMTAAPVVREIVTRMAPLMGIAPVQTEMTDREDEKLMIHMEQPDTIAKKEQPSETF